MPALALVALLLTAAPDAGSASAYYFERPLTAADLQGKSLRELSFMRNAIFARAGQVFRKPWVREHFAQYAWYKPTGLDPKKLTATDKANAAMIAKFEIAIPKDALEKRRVALETKLVKGPVAKEDVVEMVLLSEALGVAPPSALAATNGQDPLLNPGALDKLVTVAQLQELSKRNLRILRNTVFARRGRPFTTDTMRDYFSKKNWYRADERYTDKRLTKIDLANVKLIRSVEESLGGPEIDPGSESEPPDGFMLGA